MSCYEAGRDGFWLDRFLHAHGIDNRIVDSASIEVRRRARRVKTDRLDAQKLLTMLHREALGEKDVWSVVHVPSVADEDARSLQREYRTLVKERSRSSNRIKGLLASQGLVAPRIDGRLPEWLASARLWDGSPVPSGMRARVEREFARWRFTHDQVLALEKERRDRTKDETDRSLEKVRALYALKGIGLGAAWTWGLEFFTWRNFRNGKQVGALSGLAPNALPERRFRTRARNQPGRQPMGSRPCHRDRLGLAPPPTRQCPHPLVQRTFCARRPPSSQGRDRRPGAKAPRRAVALRRDGRTPGGSRPEGLNLQEQQTPVISSPARSRRRISNREIVC